jgi:cystathionine gamma-lyase
LHQKIRFFQNAIGNVLSPFDCFLTLRGIKTFALRMERQCENALKIAQFLAKHTKVNTISYPGLAIHPDWMLVGRKLLRKGLGGGTLAVQVRGNAMEFVKRLQVFLVAESLGGVESLVEIPSLMTHAGLTPEERKMIGISDDLVRISVGIEHVDDLIGDLNQALE